MEEVTAQQCSKGKKRVLELLECKKCQDHGLECKLGPGKSTSCKECHEVKAKYKCSRDEKLEWKWKQTRVEEVETGPSSLKKKMSEEKSNGMVELAEVLQAGLRGITDALSKQRRLLQELMELETDKIELMQYDQWALEDKENEEDDEMEEGEEVEVEQELPELAKE